MCCQLTWWRALGITAQQRPASKKVRTSVPPPAVLQIWATGICKFNLIFLSCFLCGHKNKGTFPESSLLMPPLPVLRFTLWYPTYIRKRPWKGKKKKKKTGSTQRVTAIYWQTHAIAQTTKHSYYSTSLLKAGGKPVWKHYESRQVPTVTAVRWGYLVTTRVCIDNPPRRYFF